MAMWGIGIMVGPILGPPLGGWLTEDYSWHWVFLINVPLGIIALLGVMASMPADAHRPTRFDLRGLLFIAIGIGSLQLVLDRGNVKDWLSSTEIRIELALALLGLYLYYVHWRTRRNPFVDLALLRDRNFGAANLFIFVLGVVLFATIAPLPPYMQNLMDYPVITTGMLLTPRGVGTMVSMIVVGRILARGVDPRLPVAIGIVLTSMSMWLMSQWNADVPMWPFINTGIIQGLGLGLVFVGISTMAYATLPMAARTEAASIYSLVRNIGSSVGISIVFTVVARYTQVNHAEIVTHLTRYGSMVLPANLTDSRGLILLNEMVTRQVAAIGYLNDFTLMTWLTLAMLPLLLLFRVPRRRRPSPDPVATASASGPPLLAD